MCVITEGPAARKLGLLDPAARKAAVIAELGEHPHVHKELLRIAIFAVGVALLLNLLDSGVALNFVMMALYAALLAQAWNILGGYGGQFSFGHALFFGTGAYVQAIAQLGQRGLELDIADTWQLHSGDDSVFWFYIIAHWNSSFSFELPDRD